MNLRYHKLLTRLLLEGIQIKDFEKLSDDPEFINACKIYKSEIKNDNDAKQRFNLGNLDIYKQNLQEFIERVKQAYEYIHSPNGQRAFNNLLKKPLSKGVNLVYKDKSLMIVSPSTFNESHSAAYLDDSEANWCVAVPAPGNKIFCRRYEAQFIFYIYTKDQSYSMIVTPDDVENILKTGNFSFSQLENRANDTLENKERIKRNYRDLLSRISLNKNQLEEILVNYIIKNKDNDFYPEVKIDKKLAKIKNGEKLFAYRKDIVNFDIDLPRLEIGNAMFYECSNLKTFNSKLSSLENGEYMFNECSNLKTFNADLSNLKNGIAIFRLCYNLKTFNADLSSLENGYKMFYDCRNLTTFNSNLSSLENGYSMFEECTSLTSFKSNLSSLEKGHYMFCECHNLTTFNSNLSSLRHGICMFLNCKLNLKSLKNIANTINTVSDRNKLTLGLDKAIENNPLTNKCLEIIKQKGWDISVKYN